MFLPAMKAVSVTEFHRSEKGNLGVFREERRYCGRCVPPYDEVRSDVSPGDGVQSRYFRNQTKREEVDVNGKPVQKLDNNG